MEIKFQGKYKSLSSFETPVLEKFVVLTGKNGSDKSGLPRMISRNDRYILSYFHEGISVDSWKRNILSLSKQISTYFPEQTNYL